MAATVSNKPPSWNAIRDRAAQFAHDYSDKVDENAYAQPFWIDFLNIFGIDHKRVRARFEQTAKRESTGGRGRIDMFWPRLLLVEHKSAGKSLEQAEAQALDYLQSIEQDEWPLYVVTSNFQSMRIKSLETGEPSFEFPLTDLVKEIDRFGFIAGYAQRALPAEQQADANGEAARLMGRLYEEANRNGYNDHEASILLMRILFLLFGDDTGMWETNLFDEFLRTRTNPDGTDLGPQLTMLFQTLDKPEGDRSQALDELIKRFPYVNGGLYRERLDIPTFDKAMRDELLLCSAFNWGVISPAIFGSMFQSIKSAEARGELGEHYTSETNILKLIGPLFLDELEEQFDKAKDQVRKLDALLNRLSGIRIFDPACGCGNFLIVAYRELRSLELRILVRLRELNGDDRLVLDATMNLVVRLDHFFGIEIEEWPAEIAEVAMFLVDHQANLDLAKEFGLFPTRLPIDVSATIVRGNALNLDWNAVIPASDDVYVLGNPPFLGHISRSKEQTDDLKFVWGREDIGRLDYVTAWYKKACDYFQGTSGARFAFVSTNSITQGEPVPALFGPLFNEGWRIGFAHRTFAWSSEAPGMAHVHCVIIGFDKRDGKAQLFRYSSLKSEPVETIATNINAYLVDAPNVLVKQTREVLGQDLVQVSMGSMPRDGGHLLINSPDEYEEVMRDSVAARYVRRFIMGSELINNIPRWCFWLEDLEPGDVEKSPELGRRLKAVANNRLESAAASTRQMAATPHLFGQRSQPEVEYLAIPSVFSESRRWATVERLSPDVIAGNKIYKCEDPDGYAFAIASSAMFITWQKAVGGRLKSDPNFSNTLVWNSFPLPKISPELKMEIIESANGVIFERNLHPDSSLANLYNPLSMNPSLIKAHERLDKLVDRAFGASKLLKSAEERERLLFVQYLEMTKELTLQD